MGLGCGGGPLGMKEISQNEGAFRENAPSCRGFSFRTRGVADTGPRKNCGPVRPYGRVSNRTCTVRLQE